MKISHRDFISRPYKKCPNPQCLTEEAFGVDISVGSTQMYTRECIKCGYHENYALPNIRKKILYLDQFVISNLVKLLDKSHPSHTRIKADSFWENLFVKLEGALKSWVIACPSSRCHRDESLIGNVDFRLMKRLYEYFSNGEAVCSGSMIQRNQIVLHFEGWLDNKKTKFEFKLEDIADESLMRSMYFGDKAHLQKKNTLTKTQLEVIWARWKSEPHVGFVERIKEEALGNGVGLGVKQFVEEWSLARVKMTLGKEHNLYSESFCPPMFKEIFAMLINIARKKGISETQIPETIVRYFNDVDSLLEIPIIRITSVMFAGLAHRAVHGKKRPPKSVVDVEFISSYLPYCDALFVDKESALLLKEFPENAPSYSRLQEFPAKVFSLNNKDEFLDYLDRLIDEIPSDQVDILKDMAGENYVEPYWNIIEDEKRKLGISML